MILLENSNYKKKPLSKLKNKMISTLKMINKLKKALLNQNQVSRYL